MIITEMLAQIGKNSENYISLTRREFVGKNDKARATKSLGFLYMLGIDDRSVNSFPRLAVYFDDSGKLIGFDHYGEARRESFIEYVENNLKPEHTGYRIYTRHCTTVIDYEK